MTRANKSRIRRRRTDEERTNTTTVTTISMTALRHLLTILLLASLTPWVAGAQQNNNTKTKNKEVASVISKIYARGCLQEKASSSITNLYNGLITNYKCQTDNNFIPTFMISSGSSASIVSKLRIYAPSIEDEEGGGSIKLYDYYYPTSYKLEGLHSDGTYHIISEEQITTSASIMTSEQRNNTANSVINSSYEGGDIKLHYTEVSFGTDNNVEEYVHYRLQFPTTQTYNNSGDEAQTTTTYVVEMGELELVGELIDTDTDTDTDESDERDTHTDTDPTLSPSYVSFFSFFLWPPKLK